MSIEYIRTVRFQRKQNGEMENGILIEGHVEDSKRLFGTTGSIVRIISAKDLSIPDEVWNYWDEGRISLMVDIESVASKVKMKE